MKVAIIGAGAFGAALHAMASVGGASRLVPRRPSAADLAALREAETVILAPPAQNLRAALIAFRAEIAPDATLVIAAKGLEKGGGARMSEVAHEETGRAAMALSGPSFAAEMTQELPTAVTLAAGDLALGAKVQARLSTPNFRIYLTDDLAGVELGGALKNVIAIACGAASGLGLGESARAALMTRGFAEIRAIALAKGARLETLCGLSGMGDLALTCSSPLSRNYALGVALGASRTAPVATQEGAATAIAALSLSRETGARTPIIETVAALVEGRLTAAEASAALLSRPLTSES